jgi:uncharacterized YccA/Bax inhibitor family protein
MMSIGIKHFVIVIAALNLFLDFDRIEKGAEQKMPKYMEWYGAMGLMITLVWLHRIFRLLSKLNSKINNNRGCHKKKPFQLEGFL